MAQYSERSGTVILDAVTDPEGDPLTVTEINGSAALVGAPVALSIGGSITVSANGTVTFDDTGFSWPAQGASKFDGFIATVSDDHSNTVPVSVNLQLNHL